MIRKNHKPAFCDENPIDCHFDVKSYPAGTTVHNNDTNIIYLIFCMKGHARITSTFFHDEILCAGEVMFVPCGSEYSGMALSDVMLQVHKFSSPQHFNSFCKQYLGDTPGNLRKSKQ